VVTVVVVVDDPSGFVTTWVEVVGAPLVVVEVVPGDRHANNPLTVPGKPPEFKQLVHSDGGRSSAGVVDPLSGHDCPVPYFTVTTVHGPPSTWKTVDSSNCTVQPPRHPVAPSAPGIAYLPAPYAM
jgi:hypothetical protein